MGVSQGKSGDVTSGQEIEPEEKLVNLQPTNVWHFGIQID
jgi:hypothetical protein